MKIPNNVFALGSFLALSSAAPGVVIFGLANNDDLDGTVGAGTSQTETDDTDPTLMVTLTTVDVLTPEYEEVPDGGGGTIWQATGNTLSALNGDGGGTNVTSAGDLGINNPSINNTNYASFGTGSESSNFEPGESWVFEFDTDVVFDLIDFASLGAGDTITLSVEGGPSVDFVDGTTSDIFTDPLSSLVIPAGTDLTFSVSGDLSTTNVRIADFSVIAVIPEPSTTTFLGLLGLFASLRRRRH